MSFIIMTAEDNGECAIAKKPVGTRSWSVFMQEVITGGHLRNLSYYSNPKICQKNLQRQCR